MPDASVSEPVADPQADPVVDIPPNMNADFSADHSITRRHSTHIPISSHTSSHISEVRRFSLGIPGQQ